MVDGRLDVYGKLDIESFWKFTYKGGDALSI